MSLLELKRYDEAFDELTRLYEQEKDSTLLNNMGVIQLRRPQGAPGGRAVSYSMKPPASKASTRTSISGTRPGSMATRPLPFGGCARRFDGIPPDHAAHYVLGVALGATGSATEAAREKDTRKTTLVDV